MHEVARANQLAHDLAITRANLESLRSSIIAACSGTKCLNAHELRQRLDKAEAERDVLRAEGARNVKGIIDCTGDVPVVRRVLGDLAITADGFIACQNSVVWHPTDGGCYPVPDGLNMAAKVYGGTRLVDVGECYSSLDAAQKAKAAMEGGK